MIANQATEHPSNPATPLKGWVNTYFRHYKGKKLGPYYVRRWKVGRRVFKQYIKPEDVEKVKAQCQAHRLESQRRKREGRRIVTFIDNYNFLGRIIDTWDRGKEIRKDQEAYALRLHNEGMYITGRPLYRPRRAFMVPKFSKRFFRYLQLTQNFRLARLMCILKVKPHQIDIDLGPTNDPETEMEQFKAVELAHIRKVFR